MTKARRELAAAMPSQDVILQVLDARMPRASENPVIAELRGYRPCLTILTKSDVADPDVTEAWLRWFEGARGVRAIAVRSDQAGASRARILELCARLSPRRPLHGLIAGVPNVGKSTLINTLMNRRVAAASDKPAVTKAQQRVVLEGGMVLLDTPGLLWPKIEDEDASMRLALAGSIPDTAIDSLTVATFGARWLLASYPDRVLARFKLATLPETADALLAEIGRRRGCLRSGGVVDLHKAADILVHEVRARGFGRVSFEAPP
jgi:ribosome biogenesis GTPase A